MFGKCPGLVLKIFFKINFKMAETGKRILKMCLEKERFEPLQEIFFLGNIRNIWNKNY